MRRRRMKRRRERKPMRTRSQRIQRMLRRARKSKPKTWRWWRPIPLRRAKRRVNWTKRVARAGAEPEAGVEIPLGAHYSSDVEERGPGDG